MTTEKRAIDKDNLLFNVSAVLVDIEGTTTSINFVKETLFPYVREHLEEYVNSKWSEEELKADVALLRDQAVKDTEDKVEGVVNIPEGEGDEVKTSVINNVLWQMDGDRKTKALKQLQGHIWRNGYSSGKIIGHLYDDVKDCLKSWSEAGKKIFVYSSGSVEAQKLLFGNTKDGDLLSIFSGHFDTEVGPKTESSSYVKILKQLKESSHVANDPKDVLFLTDVPKEAQAATDAGMQVAVVIREGNAPLPDDIKDTFPTISSFSDLIFEGNTKRRKLSHEPENNEEKNKNVEGGNDVGKDMEMEVCPSDDNKPLPESVKVENSKETVNSTPDSVNGDKAEETTIKASESENNSNSDVKMKVTPDLEASIKIASSPDKPSKTTSEDVSSSEDLKIENGVQASEDTKVKVCVEKDASKVIDNECSPKETDNKKNGSTDIENKITNGDQCKNDAPDSTVESDDVEMEEHVKEEAEKKTESVNKKTVDEVEELKKSEEKSELHSNMEVSANRDTATADKKPEETPKEDKPEDIPKENDVGNSAKGEPDVESKTVEVSKLKDSDKKEEKKEEEQVPVVENGKENSVDIKKENSVVQNSEKPVVDKMEEDIPQKEEVSEKKSVENEELPKVESTNVEETKPEEMETECKETNGESKAEEEMTKTSGIDSTEDSENKKVVNNEEAKTSEEVTNDKTDEKEINEKNVDEKLVDGKVDVPSVDKTETNKADGKDILPEEDKNNSEVLNNVETTDENKETDDKKTDINNLTPNGTHETFKNGVTEDEVKNTPEENPIKEKIVEKIKESSTDVNGVETTGKV